MIQVVGAEQVVNKQQQPSMVAGRSFEQYGQPEPSPLPPGYKPFGSWGLYIGGNPADGYYTNYYKALANSVDKQQVTSVVEPQAGAGVSAVKPGTTSGQVAPVGSASPMYKQAVSSSTPYVGSDYYPFAYSPVELNSGASPVVHSSVVSMVPQQAPVVGGPQVSVYSAGSPSMDMNSHVLSYSTGSIAPEMYATKRLGSVYAQKEVKEPQTQQQIAPPSPAKGYYQSRFYSYQPVSQAPASTVGSQSSTQQAQVVPAHHQHSATFQQHTQHPQQHQVVAYPVPVGSQMVGSQPGVDGAFSPYGVHAFTRYAVKPTVVSSSDQGYYYSQVYSPVGHSYSTYKQQVAASPGAVVPPAVGYGQPMNFYGYPTSQLHYSAGPLVSEHQQQVGVQPHQHHQPQQHGSVVPVGPQMSPNFQVEAASEKSESEDKSVVSNKQQQHKRA